MKLHQDSNANTNWNTNNMLVKYAAKLKYARSARSSNPFGGQSSLHKLCNLCKIERTRSITTSLHKGKVELAKCWECSQNLSQVCKWHSWEANCKDFLLRAQTYTFILLDFSAASVLLPVLPMLQNCPYCLYCCPSRADPAVWPGSVPNSSRCGFIAKICESAPARNWQAGRNRHLRARNMHVSVRGNPTDSGRNKDLLRAQIAG